MFSKRLSGLSSSKNRANSSNQGMPSKGPKGVVSPGSPDNAVVIPYIKSQDNGKLLPKYTAALARSKEEYLPAEDLDAIQLELELLLSSVAQRYRILKAEFDAIEREDRRDRKNKFVEKPPTSPGKRKRTEDKKTKDRFLSSLKIAKQRVTSINSPAQSLQTDDSLDALPHSTHHSQKDRLKSSVPKNDVPNKFWLSVEPYCMPITHEDLKLLDDLLEQYSGPLVPPIPELGPHYSTTWATEDLREERVNSNLNSKMKSRQLVQSDEVAEIVKKGEKIMGEGVTGPFTQRLVSVLLEENLIVDGLSTADSNSSSENISAFNVRSVMRNGISIEKRLKKELAEQGIIDPQEYENQEDEVLSEIKRVLAELSAIAEYNSGEIRKLSIAGKEELKRLELKRKLDTVDQEIIEMYKKVLIAKQKRRQLSTQEREDIYRLTEEQKRLSDQLESMRTPGPKFMD